MPPKNSKSLKIEILPQSPPPPLTSFSNTQTMSSTSTHYLRDIETALACIPDEQSPGPTRHSNWTRPQSQYLKPLHATRQFASVPRVISSRRQSDSSPLQKSTNEEDLQKDIELALSCMPVETMSPKRSVMSILSEEIMRMEMSTQTEGEPVAESENENDETLGDSS